MGTTQCPNTCDELGRAAREESERMATLLKEGYQKRLEMAYSGKEFRKSKDEEKAKLEAERQKLESIKQDKEKIKDQVEAPEKEALDR
jgi:protein kinase C substrate 80K-H